MVLLDRVAIESLDDLWPVLEPYIQAAIVRGDAATTTASILAKARSGHRMIWTVLVGDRLAGVAVSGLRPGQIGQTAFIEFAAGEGLHLWLDDALDAFEARARAARVAVIETDESRLGWIPALRLKGYRPVRVVMRKVLDYG